MKNTGNSIHGARSARNHDAKHQFMTQSVNLSKRKHVKCGKYSYGEGILKAKLNKNVVPNVTHGE